LPVLFVLVVAFSLCTKQSKNATLNSEKVFTVMIDAGHGGEISGARTDDGTMEKDLALSIANKIRELNSDKNIRIVLSRIGDYDVPLRERVTNAVRNQVDAFISIHVNTADPSNSGFEFYVTKNDSKYNAQTQVLGSLMSQELKKIYAVSDELKKRSDGKGVWVLDAPDISYPSLLVECGNIRNGKDLAFIKSDGNQEKVARSILSAIRAFAQNGHAVADAGSAVEVTVNKGAISFMLNDGQVVNVDPSTLIDGSAKKIIIEDAEKMAASALVIVDGKVISDISQMNLKNATNLKMAKTLTLNDRGPNKVVLITTSGHTPLLPL
jgi:N-acetylmuramoyl-L-alanine amidase